LVLVDLADVLVVSWVVEVALEAEDGQGAVVDLAVAVPRGDGNEYT